MKLGVALLLALIVLPGCAPSVESTTILSRPTGARVYVDGQFQGETPLEISLEKRTHRVRLERDGYNPTTDHISVRAREPMDLIPRLFAYVMGWTGLYDRKYTFEESYLFRLQKAEPSS